MLFQGIAHTKARRCFVGHLEETDSQLYIEFFVLQGGKSLLNSRFFTLPTRKSATNWLRLAN